MKAAVPPQDHRRAALSGPAIPSGDQSAYPPAEGHGQRRAAPSGPAIPSGDRAAYAPAEGQGQRLAAPSEPAIPSGDRSAYPPAEGPGQRRAAPSGPAIPSGDRSAYPPAEGPTSPCVNVCQMDAASGWCRGCARSLQEIAGWGSAGEARQRQILALLPLRRAELRRLGLWLGPNRPE